MSAPTALEPGTAERPSRMASARLAAGTLLATAVIALVDPSEPGRYPSCPTHALLGLDCPACGVLRGFHALAHGHLVEALDHNLLLLLAVPAGLAVWSTWVRTALGHVVTRRSPPAWLLPATVALMVAFTVTRNLSAPAFGWLDSAA